MVVSIFRDFSGGGGGGGQRFLVVSLSESIVACYASQVSIVDVGVRSKSSAFRVPSNDTPYNTGRRGMDVSRKFLDFFSICFWVRRHERYMKLRFL